MAPQSKTPTNETSKIPGTELAPSRIALGTWAIGGWMWGGSDDALSIRTIQSAVDRGITLIDTAPVYGFGHAEKIVGRALKDGGRRAKVAIATKVGLDWKDGKPFRNTSRARIMKEIDDSLRRLQTDVIDLYQIHWPERHVPAFGNMYYDPAKETSATPIHAQLEALGGLVKAGKVRHIGLSNESPYGVHEFVRLAEQHGLPRVATVQNVYCLISRAVENGLDETMHRLGVSLLAYSPLAFGLLMYSLSSLVDANNKIPFWTLFMVYVIQSVGELCLSPIGLSMVTKLAPTRLVGMGMGGWFLSTGIGNNLSGIFASAVSGEGGMTTASAHSGYTFGFWTLTIAGVILFLAATKVQKLMHGVK